MREGVTMDRLASLVTALVVVTGFPISQAMGYLASQGSCCYGDRQVLQGQVVLNLPKCCAQLVCTQGRIVERRIGYPGQTNCCEFDGVMYPPGHVLGQCFPLVCREGSWVYTGDIDDCCRHCYLYDDPHVSTFDGHRYDWHGVCNYTMAASDSTHYPEVGVFSDFVRCFGCASCLAHTTFRNDPDTLITLDNGAVFVVWVNGFVNNLEELDDQPRPLKSHGGKTHPVMAWRRGSCTVLLGSSDIVVQHCRHRLDIWAHPSHAEGLDGLCGHFNYYKIDDFTDRSGAVHTLEYWPWVFPRSWKTMHQRDPQCRAESDETACGVIGNPCKATRDQMVKFKNTCTDFLKPIIRSLDKLDHYIDTCAFDLCIMSQSNRGNNEVREWLGLLQDNVHIARDIFLRTTGDGSEPGTTSVISETLTGTSSTVTSTSTIIGGSYTVLTITHSPLPRMPFYNPRRVSEGSPTRTLHPLPPTLSLPPPLTPHPSQLQSQHTPPLSTSLPSQTYLPSSTNLPLSSLPSSESLPLPTYLQSSMSLPWPTYHLSPQMPQLSPSKQTEMSSVETMQSITPRTMQRITPRTMQRITPRTMPTITPRTRPTITPRTRPTITPKLMQSTGSSLPTVPYPNSPMTVSAPESVPKTMLSRESVTEMLSSEFAQTLPSTGTTLPFPELTLKAGPREHGITKMESPESMPPAITSSYIPPVLPSEDTVQSYEPTQPAAYTGLASTEYTPTTVPSVESMATVTYITEDASEMTVHDALMLPTWKYEFVEPYMLDFESKQAVSSTETAPSAILYTEQTPLMTELPKSVSVMQSPEYGSPSKTSSELTTQIMQFNSELQTTPDLLLPTKISAESVPLTMSTDLILATMRSPDSVSPVPVSSDFVLPTVLSPDNLPPTTVSADSLQPTPQLPDSMVPTVKSLDSVSSTDSLPQTTHSTEEVLQHNFLKQSGLLGSPWSVNPSLDFFKASNSHPEFLHEPNTRPTFSVPFYRSHQFTMTARTRPQFTLPRIGHTVNPAH